MRTALLAIAAFALGHIVAAAQPASTSAATVPTPSQRVALVTGSTDGLGREVARRLAAEGAHVIVHGRNAERGKAVVDEINAAAKGSARFYQADFASLAEVRSLADAVTRDYPRLDLLVNNAGVVVRDARQVSKDGHELHFAVNYLSGYLLTYKLLPLIEKGRAPRIVNVSSLSAAPIDFTDVMIERDYSTNRGYGQSKLSQVMFTIDLAAELKDKGIVVQSLHPATYMNTSMILSAGLTPRSTVEEGTAAVMNAITTDAPSGSYFVGQKLGTPHAQAADAGARRRLREVTRTLVGLP
ncbi:3-oxoacyl-[acyl-carrier-protein] reductase FabG [Luteitalea pratensis]|uniref:3-oxoacyl-[acyl-carrier-protein] reductase FabG n=1 Tax=Luteitalea pratensis TaxID=1855912 RepID=A0A143PH89_LUTPR|nr:SDR family NAD(P)-dependent oxidoreductase [Luteitalea pratensis]AMY07613.1 3-oxoacyl-[acyl-carrier-protein] reductase FabG [Luteitalea pratensis]